MTSDQGLDTIGCLWETKQGGTSMIFNRGCMSFGLFEMKPPRQWNRNDQALLV